MAILSLYSKLQVITGRRKFEFKAVNSNLRGFKTSDIEYIDKIAINR
jgi:hypothetical protein